MNNVKGWNLWPENGILSVQITRLNKFNDPTIDIIH